MTKTEAYRHLGLKYGASEDDVKSKFRELSKQYHPDITGGDKEKEDQFKIINDAYSVLTGKQKEKVDFGFNDFYGHHSGGNPFEAPFGGFGSSFDPYSSFNIRDIYKTREPLQGGNIVIDFPLEVFDYFNESKKKIEYKCYRRCKDCEGTGSLTKNRNDVEICPFCQGKKVISTVEQVGARIVQQVMPCYKCAGMGSVFKSPCGCGDGLRMETDIIEFEINRGDWIDNYLDTYIDTYVH